MIAIAMPDGRLETISNDELVELLKHEAVIRNGLKTFLDVGRAFAAIKKARLYRAKYGTFEAYCEAEWEMSDRHALNFERAAEVVDTLAAQKFLVLPETESQARPLLKLPPAEWPGAWEEVLGLTHGKITAAIVTEVVQRRLNRLTGHGTEVVARRPAAQAPEESKVIDLPDLSSREKRIRAVASETLLRLRELEELMGTGYTQASGVRAAILDIDELQDHLGHREQMQGARQKGAL